MSYTPINWQTGQTITAEKLNKMDNGWSADVGAPVEICNETVAMEDDGLGNYSGQLSVSEITANTIYVTFDNVNYTCSLNVDMYGAVYDEQADAMDWSEYPFAVYTDGYIATQTGGTHNIIISSVGDTVIETSSDFQSAVKSISDESSPMECVQGVTTFGEMAQAYNSGRMLYFKPFQQKYDMRFITSFNNNTINFIPEDVSISAMFANDIFVVGV